MKTTLKVFSIISVVIGSLAFFGGLTAMASDPDAGYQVVGGLFFLAQGIVGLVYISQQK